MSNEFPLRSDRMSDNVIDIMIRLSKNKGLVQLLLNNVSKPFDINITDEDMRKSAVVGSSDSSRISPRPFNPETQQVDSSFIRVYYNIGDFETNEVFMDAEIHIDIVVAKNLWLINGRDKSLIRPYEIMNRIVDLVGKRSANPIVQFNGFQHLAVNNNFDAIRLYAKHYNA